MRLQCYTACNGLYTSELSVHVGAPIPLLKLTDLNFGAQGCIQVKCALLIMPGAVLIINQPFKGMRFLAGFPGTDHPVLSFKSVRENPATRGIDRIHSRWLTISCNENYTDI